MLLDEPVTLRLGGVERWVWPSVASVPEVSPEEMFPAQHGHSPTVRGGRVVIDPANITHGASLREHWSH